MRVLDLEIKVNVLTCEVEEFKNHLREETYTERIIKADNVMLEQDSIVDMNNGMVHAIGRLINNALMHTSEEVEYNCTSTLETKTLESMVESRE